MKFISTVELESQTRVCHCTLSCNCVHAINYNCVVCSVQKWCEEHRLNSVGIPCYVAHGNHMRGGKSYRFLVLSRFREDLETIFVNCGRVFSSKTVCMLALTIVCDHMYSALLMRLTAILWRVDNVGIFHKLQASKHTTFPWLTVALDEKAIPTIPVDATL